MIEPIGFREWKLKYSVYSVMLDNLDKQKILSTNTLHFLTLKNKKNFLHFRCI